MESVVSFFQRLIPGASTESISRSLGVVITVALLAVSTVIALTTNVGKPSDGNDGSSEKDDIGGHIIDVSRAEADADLRDEIYAKIEQKRLQAGLEPRQEGFNTVMWADQHATRNAQTQRYNSPTQHGVVVLQGKLAYADATADAFYANWAKQADSNCALAAQFDDYGVGVKSASGTTFAVIYIRNITEQHDACKA